MTALSQTPVIRIRVDSSAATPGINSINRQLGTLGTTGGTANQQLSRLVTNFGSAGAAAGNTSRQLSAANSNAQALHSMFGSLGQSAGAAASRMAGLGGSITGVAMAGSTLVAGALVGGLVALGSAAVNASAKMESYRASLTTILGDSDKAATAMARLSEFAAKTPFSLDQSVQGFIKLKALGLQPTEAAMMSYGNTASAMGKDMMQLVEAVADASTGEFERLKEFGIKASKEGDKVSFVFQGVKTTVKNNSQEIQKYLQDIGNNQFGGAMQKQMATFAGAMSNLEDTIDQTMARVGDAGLNKAVASVITMISDGITSVAPLLTGLGNMMAGAVSGVVALVSGVGDIFGSINTAGPGGITIMEKLSFVLSALGYSFNLIGTIAGAAFSAVGAVVQNVSQMMTGALGGALSWLGVSFQSSGRSWGNSIMGVMRAVQTVATLMPQIFSIAVNDVMRMFRDLGGAISALVSGNWEQAKALATKVQFTNTNQAVAAAWKMGSVTYRDEKGADAELQRFLGRGPKVGTESLGDLAGAAPKAAADAAKKEADDAAKKAAERLKRENEFWTALKDQTTAAGMLRKEAENYNKQVELRKILERDLLPAEQARLTAALKELDTAKILGSMRQRALDLSNEYTAEQGRQLGLTESQKAVEDEVIKARLAALNEGVDISSTAYKIAEADLIKQAEKVQALKDQRDLITQANDFAGKFSTGADRMSRLFDLDKQMENFRKQFQEGKLTFNGQPMSQAIYDAAVNGWPDARRKIEQEPLEIAAKYDVKLDRQMRIGDVENERREMQSSTWFQGLDKKAQERILSGMDGAVAKIRGEATDDFIDMFDDLASQFGGKIGKAIKGVADMIDRIAQASRGEDGAGKLLTMISTGMGDGYKAAASSMLDIAGSAADMGKTTKSLLSNFGKGGSITKGIGQAVGGAMAGLQIGQEVGSAMKGLGIKGSDGGAKIGGAIGGITGNPIIAAGASVIGGLIGSMFYKAPAGAAYLKGQDPASVVGTNKGAKKAAGEAGEAVQAGLAAIADRFGGTLGAYDVIIGKYNDKWRVRDGTEDGWAGKSLDFKGMSANGLKDFGDDASAAISYAIQNAIKDGAIKGISDFASKALSKLDVDAAVSLVEAFNSITDELDAMVDPIGQAARAINKPIDQLIDQMKEVGAASADLAKAEEYRTKKLDEALKAQVSSIDDMLTKLRGEARGVTKMQQFETAMKEFDAYRTRIDAGDKSVDKDAFLALVDKIAGLNTEIFTNATSEAQANFHALIMASEKLKANVTDTFNTAAGRTAANVTVDNTSAAIAQQTSALASATKRVEDQIANDNAIMKEYLRQIASGISGMNDNSRGEGVLYRQNTLNGQYLSDRA